VRPTCVRLTSLRIGHGSHLSETTVRCVRNGPRGAARVISCNSHLLTGQLACSGNRWERVMLKVSGEALAGPNGFGIDNEVVQAVAREVAIAVLSGVQVHALPPAPGPPSVFAGEGTPASADRMSPCVSVTGLDHPVRSCRVAIERDASGRPPRLVSSAPHRGRRGAWTRQVHVTSRTEHSGPARHSRRPGGGGARVSRRESAQLGSAGVRSARPYAMGSHQLSQGSSPHTHAITHSHIHSLIGVPEGASWCRACCWTGTIGCLEIG
jgi:hypothetical protein